MPAYTVLVIRDGAEHLATSERIHAASPADALIAAGLIRAETVAATAWSDGALRVLRDLATTLDVCARRIDLRGYAWAPGRAAAVKEIRRLARDTAKTARRARRSNR